MLHTVILRTCSSLYETRKWTETEAWPRRVVYLLIIHFEAFLSHEIQACAWINIFWSSNTEVAPFVTWQDVKHEMSVHVSSILCFHLLIYVTSFTHFLCSFSSLLSPIIYFFNYFSPPVISTHASSLGGTKFRSPDWDLTCFFLDPAKQVPRWYDDLKLGQDNFFPCLF
jgi:hypothetical protein